MKTYHLRRSEKAIQDTAVLRQIIQSERYLTLAMSKDNIPYLVTLNYGYDPERACFYFHCAKEGKKIDYLQANPTVWGQILQDHGYVQGACDHTFRSVHFRGTVAFLERVEEKARALDLMIEQLEDEPEQIKQRLKTPEALTRIAIGKIEIQEMHGKASLRPTP